MRRIMMRVTMMMMMMTRVTMMMIVMVSMVVEVILTSEHDLIWSHSPHPKGPMGTTLYVSLGLKAMRVPWLLGTKKEQTGISTLISSNYISAPGLCICVPP